MVNCRDIHDIQNSFKDFLLTPYNRYYIEYEITHRRATQVNNALINEIRSISNETM